jgi:hypothetical protein
VVRRLTRGLFFSVQAFSNLKHQIRSLAFASCSGRLGSILPPQTLKHIPSDFPEIYSAHPDSVKFRSCLIMGIISQILCRRVFDPFLFTLSSHHDDANRILQEKSRKLRQTSPKREATWRQQTLHAAYTAPQAKETVNQVAANIVTEIVEAVEPLADLSKRKELVVAVRKIVKTAAEAWRYTR